MSILQLVLSHLAPVGPHAARELGTLPGERRVFRAGQTIGPQPGDGPVMALMRQGVAVRAPAAGRRGCITSIYTGGQLFGGPGDGDGWRVLSRGTSCVEFLSGPDLARALDAHPALMRLMWRITLAEAQILQGWLAASGSLRAPARLAHLLCEMDWRNDAAGGARPDLPLRQTEIAKMLGYTAIHINRAARELRERGLILWDRDGLRILDGDGLRRLARFDPQYLRAAFALTHPAPVAMAAE